MYEVLLLLLSLFGCESRWYPGQSDREKRLRADTVLKQDVRKREPEKEYVTRIFLNFEFLLLNSTSAMLLFLHGALYTKGDFNSLTSLLSDRFDLHAIDFSGHGSAPMPEQPFSIKLFAEDVLCWMDEQKIDHVDIFGFSMGGYVGLYLARFHPERVRRVMTLGTKIDWNAETCEREVKMLDPVKIAEKVPSFAALLQNRHGEDRWETVLHKTAEMMTNLGSAPELPYDEFSAIAQPVRLGVGDHDPMVTIEETLKAYRLLPAGELYVLPGVLHQLEKAPVEKLAREIAEFFAS